MKKQMFLIFASIMFFINSHNLNGMFSDSEFEPNPSFGLFDPEDSSSVEYETIFYLQKLKKQDAIYSEIENAIITLLKERRVAINITDYERVLRIDEKISDLKKIIRYNFKKSLILFIKSTCPIF